jgi:hypothetical protein
VKGIGKLPSALATTLFLIHPMKTKILTTATIILTIFSSLTIGQIRSITEKEFSAVDSAASEFLEKLSYRSTSMDGTSESPDEII